MGFRSWVRCQRRAIADSRVARHGARSARSAMKTTAPGRFEYGGHRQLDVPPP